MFKVVKLLNFEQQFHIYCIFQVLIWVSCCLQRM